MRETKYLSRCPECGNADILNKAETERKVNCQCCYFHYDYMPLFSGTRLKHYKGGEYTILGQGIHSETSEHMVIYQSDTDGQIWLRPLHMFHESVEVDGETLMRFEPMGDE